MRCEHLDVLLAVHCVESCRTDLRQAESWLRKAETDLEAMSKMASDLEGVPLNQFHVMSLASQVVDMSLKSAMLRLRGLTEEEFAGHHFSVLHRHLRHAAARHTETSLPGDVCDMEWMKGIYLATHPSPGSAHRTAQCQRSSIKDARRAGALAHETVRWVRALSDTLAEIPKKTPISPTHVEPMDNQSPRSYDDFEDFEENLSQDTYGDRMEAWVAPVSGTMAQTEQDAAKKGGACGSRSSSRSSRCYSCSCM